MKRSHKSFAYFLLLFAIVFACTKDVTLFTEVEFELLDQREEEGFVNQGLSTTFTIVPEAELEGYEYVLTYEVTQGTGFFQDEEGKRLEAGKGMVLSPYQASLLYIGSETGVHIVKVTASDNFGISEEIEISYTLEDVPVSWIAASEVAQIELGEQGPIELTLGSPLNTVATTYEANYSLTEGSGSLRPNEPESYAPGTDFAVIEPGTYSLLLLAEELGPLEIVFNLLDANGQELTTALKFEVVQTIEVISIDLGEHDELDMEEGGTIECPVTFNPPNATDQGIVWESSDPEVVVVDDQGNFSALSIGTATITATSISNPEASATIVVTVSAAPRVPVTSITVVQEDPDANGATRQLVANVLPGDATDTGVIWSSDNEGIASVDETGLVMGLSVGIVTITATSVSDPAISDALEIEITAASLQAGTDILTFSLPVQNDADIDTVNHIITVNVADGTDVEVAPSILTVSPGATIAPGLEEVRNFNSSVAYTVTAGNGDEQIWTVNVTVSPPDGSGENDIVAFTIPGQTGESVFDTANATVTITVPDGTNLQVAPEQILISVGAGISPSPGNEQDFSNPVEYTVTAENGSERVWTINVNVSPPDGRTGNDITVFELPVQNSSSINLNSHTITVNVTEGTDLNVAPQNLTISEGAGIDPSLTTVLDFSTPTVYTVTAENGTAQEWTVNVTVSPLSGSSENAITAFELPQQNTSLIDADNFIITVNVHAGVTLNVVPSVFDISPGATVFPLPTTRQDFSGIIAYTVTAENGTEQIWQVQVTISPDNTAPVITLVGSNPQELTTGGNYVELGAIATDNVDGDISSNMVIDASSVNLQQAGDYIVTYNVEDAAGNSAIEVTRVVRVSTAADTTAPVITLIGGDVDLTVGQAYTEQGATATDNVDGDITSNIVVDDSAVDTNTIGSYNVTYNVSDAAGNAAVEVVRTVRVTAAPDTTPPVITLIGGDVDLTVGQAYTEQGATATDNVDGNITSNIIVDDSAVDTNTIGSYNVTYNVSDAAGNAAVEVVRTVRVSAAPDTTPPVIVLIGGEVNITVGEAYTDPGYTATDNVDGTITASVVVGGNVNTNTVGVYILTYNVSDAAGNAANEVTRTVNVNAAPNTPPVANEDAYSVDKGGTLNRPILVNDTDADGDDLTVNWVAGSGANLGLPVGGSDGGLFTISVGGSMMFDTNGDFVDLNSGESQTTTVVYRITDGQSNSNEATVTVTVNGTGSPDTTPPVITLIGGNIVLTVGQPYTEQGATAFDNIDGDLTSNIVINSNVDIATVGDYTVTYDVSDAAGNAAVQVIRSVRVNAPPNQDPTAVITTGPFDPATLTRSFSGSNSTDPDGDDLTYQWDFDDPSSPVDTSLAESPSYTFSAPGTYNVTLTVFDGNGGQDSETIEVVVTLQQPSFTFTIDPVESPSAGPTVTFRITPNQAAIDQNIQFEMSFQQVDEFPGSIPLSEFVYGGSRYVNRQLFSVSTGISSGSFDLFSTVNCEPYSFEFTITNNLGLALQTRLVAFEYNDGGPCD